MGNDKKMLSVAEIVEMLNSGDCWDRYYAMVVCVGRSDIDVALVEKGLRDENWMVRAAAYKACVGRSDIDSKLIEKGLGDEDCVVRRSAYEACVGRSDIDVELIEKGLGDENYVVRSSAYKACVGRSDIDSKLIENGLRDEYWVVRGAAFNACVGRNDIDPKLLETGLCNWVCDVRKSAYKALKKSGHKIPLKRTFEPPTTVYKKCRNDVIVCATIPDNAQVRGKDGYKCRASAAVITDVIGDLKGEKVGVSLYDRTINYNIGDTIEIDDFDYSNEECSTGFHFFCTLEEATEY